MDKADISAQVEVQRLQIQILVESVTEKEKEIQTEKELIEECKTEALSRIASTDPLLMEAISGCEDYREMEEMHAQVVNQNKELLLLLMGERARLQEFRDKSNVQRNKAKEEFFRAKKELEGKTNKSFNELKAEQLKYQLLQQDLNLKEEEVYALKEEKNQMMNDWPDLQQEVEKLSEENLALREHTEGIYLSLQQEMARSKVGKEAADKAAYQPQSYSSFFGSINSGLYNSLGSISSFNSSINRSINSLAGRDPNSPGEVVPSAGAGSGTPGESGVKPLPGGDGGVQVGSEGGEKQKSTEQMERMASEGDLFWQKMGLPVGQTYLQYFSCCNAELKGGWFYVCEEYFVFETALKQNEVEGPIVIPIQEITQIDKRNIAIKYIPGNGRSISICTKKQGDFLFRSFLQRDAAASLILKRCEALNHLVLTTRDNKPDDFFEANKAQQSPPSSTLSPPLCPPSPSKME